MEKKYKIVPFDLVNNIWILKERVFPFVWIPRGAGQKEELERRFLEETVANKV